MTEIVKKDIWMRRIGKMSFAAGALSFFAEDSPTAQEALDGLNDVIEQVLAELYEGKIND